MNKIYDFLDFEGKKRTISFNPEEIVNKIIKNGVKSFNFRPFIQEIDRILFEKTHLYQKNTDIYEIFYELLPELQEEWNKQTG